MSGDRTRVYISGPMSGIADCNRAVFSDAAEVLVAAGCCVLNPATSPDGLSYCQYMDIAMAMVRAVEVVVMLPGAEGSAGSRAEVAYAASLGLGVCTLARFLDNDGAA